MTEQEFFDETYRRIVAQGVPSVVVEYGIPSCRYRGPNGAKCAAGQWITDAEYRPTMEGRSLRALMDARDARRLPEDHVLREHAELAVNCQQAHDNAADSPGAPFLDAYCANMREVAHKYKLTMPQ